MSFVLQKHAKTYLREPVKMISIIARNNIIGIKQFIYRNCILSLSIPLASNIRSRYVHSIMHNTCAEAMAMAPLG